MRTLLVWPHIGALPCILVAAFAIEAVLLWLTSIWLLPKFFPGPGYSVEFHEMMGDDNWLRASVWQLLAFCGLFAAYLLALLAVRRARIRRLTLFSVFVPPIIWSCTTVFMYPPYAVDLFHYVGEIRLLWVYYLNPMTVPPMAVPFPIDFSFMDIPGDYGPLWYVIGFPAALFQQHNLLFAIMALKSWIAVFYICSGALIYLIMRTQRTELALFSATLFLWNLFILIRALGDAHNDFVMIFFMLLAFYLAVKERWLLVPPALMLSVLVKYTSLLLGPLFLVYVLFLPKGTRGRAIRQLSLGWALAIVLAAAFFNFLWDGLHTFAGLRYVESQSITSLALLVQYFITEPFFHDESGGVARIFMQVIFVIPYVWLLSRSRPPIERLEGTAYLVLWFYILIALAWFRPWYLTWVVALGALLPWSWYFAMTLTISWFSMFPDIIEQYRVHIAWLNDHLSFFLLAPILVAFLPPLIIWLAGAVQTRSLSFMPERVDLSDLQEQFAE